MFLLPAAVWLLSQLLRGGVASLQSRKPIHWVLGVGSVASIVAVCDTALNFQFIFGKGFDGRFGNGYMRALPFLGVEFALTLLFFGTTIAVAQKN